MIDYTKFPERFSLEAIEGDAWGAIPEDSTTLMRTVYRLRTQPIGTLKPEDLRVLVGQQIGIDVLVPRVLALLRQDPLWDGDFYPGDILAVVLRIPSAYWVKHPAQRETLEQILSGIDSSELTADIDAFREANPSGAT